LRNAANASPKVELETDRSKVSGHEDNEQGWKYGRPMLVQLIQGAPARFAAISQHSLSVASASRP